MLFRSSVIMNANGRRNALQKEERTVTVQDRQITYLCFNWRDLESLSFNFQSEVEDSTHQFTSYKFDVTYLRTDDLTKSFGNSNPKTLFENNISNNIFFQPNFYYYIDSNRLESNSTNRVNGNGFGLYKFSFSYTYLNSDTMQQPSTVALGQFYIAVFPDDINTISSLDRKSVV